MSHLRIEFRTKNYTLDAPTEEKLIEATGALDRVTSKFPVAELHTDIHRYEREGDYHIKTSLRLPARTLFTGERAGAPLPAFERCLRKLVSKTKAYQEQMDNRHSSRLVGIDDE